MTPHKEKTTACSFSQDFPHTELKIVDQQVTRQAVSSGRTAPTASGGDDHAVPLQRTWL